MSSPSSGSRTFYRVNIIVRKITMIWIIEALKCLILQEQLVNTHFSQEDPTNWYNCRKKCKEYRSVRSTKWFLEILVLNKRYTWALNRINELWIIFNIKSIKIITIIIITIIIGKFQQFLKPKNKKISILFDCLWYKERH